MRVMVIMKATEDSEAGVMPSEQLLSDMAVYNEELMEAGLIRAGEGLHPSAAGKRLRFADGEVSVIDGPFAQTNELIAGFWIWQVDSMDDAVRWARRIPNPGNQEVELRPIMEAEDFGDEFTPELREREEQMRRELEDDEA